MTAAEQLNRIVQMVAESSRLREDEKTTLGDLAREFGVSPKQIQEDLRVLTLLGEHVDSDWLLSVEVWQEEDRVRINSRGPWRRPLRLTPDEVVALRVALATDPDGPAILAKLTNALDASGDPVALHLPGAEDRILEVVRNATRDHRRLQILYAGEGKRAASPRVVQPHQIFAYDGKWYCAAWCEAAGACRRFRLDRVVDALLAGGQFERRADFEGVLAAEHVFQAPEDGVEPVRVRFRPGIARWVKERYPEHSVGLDGSVEVMFQVANPHWLARQILQYGTEAEVVEPRAYREAVRKVVAGAA